MLDSKTGPAGFSGEYGSRSDVNRHQEAESNACARDDACDVRDV